MVVFGLVKPNDMRASSQNKPGITPEELQKIVDEIKAKVAMSNGTAERAMDAFSRAYTYGQAPAYKAKMKKNVEDAYNVRFGKKDGVDPWIATAVASVDRPRVPPRFRVIGKLHPVACSVFAVAPLQRESAELAGTAQIERDRRLGTGVCFVMQTASCAPRSRTIAVDC